MPRCRFLLNLALDRESPALLRWNSTYGVLILGDIYSVTSRGSYNVSVTSVIKFARHINGVHPTYLIVILSPAIVYRAIFSNFEISSI